MISNWARFFATVGLAVAMLGAPCRNCAPKEEAKAPCGHDCCPKPKPEGGSEPCSWQPAGFDALETAKQPAGPDWQAQAILGVPVEASPQGGPEILPSRPFDRPPPAPTPPALPPLRI